MKRYQFMYNEYTARRSRLELVIVILLGLSNNSVGQDQKIDLELAYSIGSVEMMTDFFRKNLVEKKEQIKSNIAFKNSVEAYSLFVRNEKGNSDTNRYWIVDTSLLELVIIDSIYTKREKDLVIYRNIDALEPNKSEIENILKDYESDTALDHVYTWRYWKNRPRELFKYKVPIINYVSELKEFVPIILSSKQKDELKRFLSRPTTNKTLEDQYSSRTIERFVNRVRFLERFIEVKAEGVQGTNIEFKSYPEISKISLDKSMLRMQIDFYRARSWGSAILERFNGSWKIIELDIDGQE